MRDEYDFSLAIRGQGIPYNEGRSLRVEYEGPIDPDRDKEIRENVEKWGEGKWHYVWTGQGYNLLTNVRDICFDKIAGPRE